MLFTIEYSSSVPASFEAVNDAIFSLLSFKNNQFLNLLEPISRTADFEYDIKVESKRKIEDMKD